MSIAAPPGISPEDVSGLILAGGEGLRVGEGPKAFLRLDGKTLLEHVIELISPFVGELIVGLPADYLDVAKDYAAQRPFRTVAGGATRQDTAGILAQSATRPYLLLQDVARPFTRPEHVAAVLDSVRRHGAVVTVRRATRRDGVALRDGECYGRSLPREDAILSQTPQAYRSEILRDTYRQAEAKGWQVISTADLVTMAGYRVRLQEGPTANLKITYPEDLERAQEQISRAPAARP